MYSRSWLREGSWAESGDGHQCHSAVCLWLAGWHWTTLSCVLVHQWQPYLGRDAGWERFCQCSSRGPADCLVLQWHGRLHNFLRFFCGCGCSTVNIRAVMNWQLEVLLFATCVLVGGWVAWFVIACYESITLCIFICCMCVCACLGEGVTCVVMACNEPVTSPIFICCMCVCVDWLRCVSLLPR